MLMGTGIHIATSDNDSRPHAGSRFRRCRATADSMSLRSWTTEWNKRGFVMNARSKSKSTQVQIMGGMVAFM